MAIKWQKSEARTEMAAAMLEQNTKAVWMSPDAESQWRAVRGLLEANAGVETVWMVPDRHREALRRGQMERNGFAQPAWVQLVSCEKLALAAPAEWVALAARQSKFLVLDSYQEIRTDCWVKSVRRLLLLCPDVRILGVTEPDCLEKPCRGAEELFRDAVGARIGASETMARGILPAPKPLLNLLWPWQPAQDQLYRESKGLYARGTKDPNRELRMELAREVEHEAAAEPKRIRRWFNGEARCLVLYEKEEQAQIFEAHLQELFGEGNGVPVHCYCVGDRPFEQCGAWEQFCADEVPNRRMLLCKSLPDVQRPIEGLTGLILLHSGRDGALEPLLCRALATLETDGPVAVLNNDLEGLAQTQSFVRSARRSFTSQQKDFQAEEPMRRSLQLYRDLAEKRESEWNCFADSAQDYYEKNGNLDVPRKYCTPEGRALGRWLVQQKRLAQEGELSQECIQKLEAAGFVWRLKIESTWERGYRSAKRYRARHGDLLVPVRYTDPNGLPLGEWIVYNRQRYMSGNLSQDRTERLQELGMVWNTADGLWAQSYAAAVHYYVENGDLFIPVKYTAPDGMALGIWLCSQRVACREGSLSKEQIAWLDALGMDWTNRNDRRWQKAYEAALRYKQEHGNLDVPSEYITEDGLLLGKWIARQRYALQNPTCSSARVTPERKALLDELGMEWEKKNTWQQRYDQVVAYREAHNGRMVPSQYKTEDGVWLGSWLARQRVKFQRGVGLSTQQRAAMRRLLRDAEGQKAASSSDKPSVRDLNWQENYRAASAYAKEHGDLLVPASYVDENGCRLGVWISNLRAARKTRPDSFQVTPEHIAMLDEIGMQWDAREAKWMIALHRAEEYYEKHGNLRVSVNYKTADGFCLGDWLRRVREARANKDAKLTAERIAALDAMGMQWQGTRSHPGKNA